MALYETGKTGTLQTDSPFCSIYDYVGFAGYVY